MASSRSNSTTSQRTSTNTRQEDNRVAIDSGGGSTQNISAVDLGLGATINQLAEGATLIEQTGQATVPFNINLSNFNSPGAGALNATLSNNHVEIIQTFIANDPQVAQDALEAAGVFLGDTTALINAAAEGAGDLFRDSIGGITDLFETQSAGNRALFGSALDDILEIISGTQRTNADFLEDQSSANRSLFGSALDDILEVISGTQRTNADFLEDQSSSNRALFGSALDDILEVASSSQQSNSDLLAGILSEVNDANRDTLKGVGDLTDKLFGDLSSTQGNALSSVVASVAELRAANENNAELTLAAIDGLSATRVSEGSQLVDTLPTLAGIAVAGAAAFYLMRKAA